ncbi:hypothetical protein BWZ22_14275 [Seonamhaeicola sp. S2-3]|nr:hypothetical protein BWZ22_14275 [Seonamhaeicola sp. S2-3]
MTTNHMKQLKSGLNIFDLLFFVFLFISVIVSIISIKRDLVYVMPLTIVCVCLSYIYQKKNNSNFVYIFGLLVLLVSDVLASLDFQTHFIYITILTTIYLICSTYAIRGYVTKEKLKSILSFTTFLTVGLLSYIIYILIDLLFSVLPGNTMFLVFTATICLIVFLITIAFIYIGYNYKTGTMLLTSGLFCFFQVSLSIINEFLHYNKTFVTIIMICHTLAVYLLKSFLVSTNPLKKEEIINKFI